MDIREFNDKQADAELREVTLIAHSIRHSNDNPPTWSECIRLAEKAVADRKAAR